MIKRRSFLRASAVLPMAVLPMGGCASVGQLVDTNLEQVVTDVQAVAAGVNAILPALANVGLPADVLANVSGIVGDIQTSAQAIASVYTEENAKPIVEQVAGYVLTLANVVAGIAGLPPIVSTIIQAAQILVPAIEKVLGIAGLQAPRAGGMTPDQARTVLRAYGKAN